MMQTDISTVPTLKARRTHEVFGPGSLFFALATGARTGGTVIWVREAWRSEDIHPQGFAEMLDPAHLLLARPRDQIGVLAVAEEALRSSAVALVVMELGKPIDLVAGRRLQLAAEAGGTTGLCIIPEGGGSNAAETRWHCTPVFDPADSTLHRWSLIKNKSGTLGDWNVRWDAETRRVIMVSATGE